MKIPIIIVFLINIFINIEKLIIIKKSLKKLFKKPLKKIDYFIYIYYCEINA
jgi:hypothetical protein